MCYQKNSSALAAPAGGRVPARQLPGERAACVQGSPVESRDIPISGSQGSPDRSADAHPRDRPGASAVRIPEDPRAAEPRGLESGQILGGANLSGRGINAAPAAETSASSGGASPRTLSSNGAESSVVDGFCGGSTSGRKKIPFADGRGYLHSGMLGDQIGAGVEGRRCGDGAEPNQDPTWSSEDAVL